MLQERQCGSEMEHFWICRKINIKDFKIVSTKLNEAIIRDFINTGDSNHI